MLITCFSCSSRTGRCPSQVHGQCLGEGQVNTISEGGDDQTTIQSHVLVSIYQKCFSYNNIQYIQCNTQYKIPRTPQEMCGLIILDENTKWRLPCGQKLTNRSSLEAWDGKIASPQQLICFVYFERRCPATRQLVLDKLIK